MKLCLFTLLTLLLLNYAELLQVLRPLVIGHSSTNHNHGLTGHPHAL